MISTRPALLVLLALTACSSGGGGGGGDAPDAVCVTVASRPLVWSERSPLGFSADELLRALGSQREARLVRADGSSTALDLRVERVIGGPLSFQTNEREAADAGAAGCRDAMSVPVTLAFASNDGAFDERWPMSLLAEGSAQALGHTDAIDLRAIDGTYVSPVDAAESDELVGVLNIELDGMAWSGSLVGELRTGGLSASSEHFDIGTFR